MLWIVGIVVGLLVICIIAWIGMANGIKVAGLKCNEALSGIDIALTKRYDVLTKMLDVVKGFRQHEIETLTRIVQMRSGMSMPERQDASNRMDQLSGQIRILAENYPELRSSQNFAELQRAIMDVEEHLQASRRLYNANVTAYNTKLVTFPSSMVASSMGATPRQFFEADPTRRMDVPMNF
ncbi:MAG: LemA family protein [Eubacterium sp.]|nr:LemA family protein [Eubacterium sp.]